MPLINLPLLHDLVTELDSLADHPDHRARREDLHYTLCISLGLRDHHQALQQARLLLGAPSRALATAA